MEGEHCGECVCEGSQPIGAAEGRLCNVTREMGILAFWSRTVVYTFSHAREKVKPEPGQCS